MADQNEQNAAACHKGLLDDQTTKTVLFAGAGIITLLAAMRIWSLTYTVFTLAQGFAFRIWYGLGL